MLASAAYSLAANEILCKDVVAGDHIDHMLLSTLINVSRKAIHTENNVLMLGLVRALAEFDIDRTLSGPSWRDFCTFWNELVQEAKERQFYSTPVKILHLIRHHYITLHQGTDAAPTAFSASTKPFHPVLYEPSSYPLCDIAGHLPGPTVYVPAPEFPTISLLTQPAPTEHALPVHTGPHPTDASSPSALQDIPLTATLSCPLEGTTLEDVLTPCTEPDTTEILSTASTPASTLTPEPVPEPTLRVPNESSISCDADAASASNLLHSASSVVVFFVPASSPSSLFQPLPNAGSLALFDGTTSSGPTCHATLPHLRTCGLVNNGNMCFANAVLQLLVYSPPFWNLVWQLEDLKGRRGGGLEPGGCATPLVDAMIKFFDEFVFKDKEPPPTQQPLQQPETTKGKVKEGEVEKKDNKIMDSFEPTYLYEAMKEKSQLKHMLVRTRCPCAYLMLICAGLLCKGW
jgi:Ubiquitin carboxyl-terminal hydrolase